MQWFAGKLILWNHWILVAAHFSWVCLSFTNNHPPRIKKNKSYNVIILFVGIRDYTKLHITCKF